MRVAPSLFIPVLCVAALSACEPEGTPCEGLTCEEGQTCCGSCGGAFTPMCLDPGMSCGACPGDAGGLDAGGADAGDLDAGPRTDGGASAGGAIRFVRNAQAEHEYGLHDVLPPTFGQGEMTLEVWIRLDATLPVGSTAGGEDQLTNWSDADNMPYSAGDWWYAGNFLLDGHNNGSGFELGTFSLQLYGGGRVRWLFGDGEAAGPGGHWSVGVFPASGTPSLLDDAWHRVATVRRFDGASGATLELWIDGAMVATETTAARTDMRTFWDAWPGFPSGQEGWFWGAEKQAAIGALSQYEDYKGLMSELRFWDVARSPAQLADFDRAVRGDEPGLVGRFPFSEGAGDTACDALAPTRCMTFTRWDASLWVDQSPPLRAP